MAFQMIKLITILLSIFFLCVTSSPLLSRRASVDCTKSTDAVAQGKELCPEGGDVNTLIANAQAAAKLQNTGDTCTRDRQKICVFVCRRAVVLQKPGRFGQTPDEFQTRIDANAKVVAERCT
ncbi:hypothetical protein HK096_002837 [Nowakowskiella sp. JEL0078]|nr:hypothetical protein HK096_002837 [Nowakowskiella sp. JEL0078]